MASIQINDEDFFYEENGTGEPILFLHGWGNSSGIWKYASDVLDGYRLVSFDLPGFGSLPSSLKGIKDYYNTSFTTIREFIEKRGLQSCHIVGNSIGGILGSMLATSGLPIKTLVLDSSPLMGSKCMSLKPRLFGMNRILSYPLLFLIKSQAIAEKLARNTFYSHKDIESDFYKKVVSDFTAGNVRMKYRAIKELFSIDVVQRLRSVNCPTYYVYGDKNQTIDVKLIEETLKQECPKIQFVAIKNSGHYPQVERPKLYYNQIKKMLS